MTVNSKQRNVRLHVAIDKGTGPAIVLLHGLLADGQQWLPVSEMLQRHCRVIAVDLLGHGQSERSSQLQYTVDEQAFALKRTLDALDIQGPYSLAGYSIGGVVALHYAALFGAQVKQLYMISTPFVLRPEQMVASNFAASALASKLSTKVLDTVESLLKPGRALFDFVTLNPRPRTLQDIIGSIDNELDATVIRQSIQNLIRDFDFCSDLANVTVPTTFIVGNGDPFVLPAQLTALKRYSPYMYIERMTSMTFDHFVVQHVPAAISELITPNIRDTLHVGFDIGEGKPLILLHGIESSSSYWRELASELAEDRRVIAIDLLGFGQSPAPRNIAYSIHDHVAWLKRTIDSLSLDTVELVGHSLGSIVAFAYSAVYTKSVSRLTMLSPVLLESHRHSDNTLLRNLRLFYHFSDTSYFYAYSAKLLGESQIGQFIPSIRTIEHTINHQNPIRTAIQVQSIPTIIAYGTDDRLIDKTYTAAVSKRIYDAQIIELSHAGHNFPLFQPDVAFEIINGQMPKHAIHIDTRPPSFMKQLIKLAAPRLVLVSVAYIAFGLFLLTEYAPYVLTASLIVYLLNKGYEMIHGAFSWRFVSIARLGYVSLALFGVSAAWFLYVDPQAAIMVTIYAISILLLMTGIFRLYASAYWSRTQSQRQLLLASGYPLVICGLLAIIGSMWSEYIVPFLLALGMLAKGIQLGVYTAGVVAMAYIRGFSDR